MNYYPVTTIDGLRKAIENLREDMQVEIAEGVNISAKTVGKLRALTTFPSGQTLRIITPREPDRPESVVMHRVLDVLVPEVLLQRPACRGHRWRA